MNAESVSVKITGTMIAYYFICKRKLWYFSKGLDIEDMNPTDDVLIGRLLGKMRFKRASNKELTIGDSVVDFFEYKGQIIVHEVKKSRKFEQAHIWQVKYYIYLLRKAGLEARYGVIHYPKAMRKIEVVFEEDDEKKVEEAIMGIKEVIASPVPPPPLNKSFCKKCAYYEFCYI